MRLRLLTLTLAAALFGLSALTPFAEPAAAAPPTTSGLTHTISTPVTLANNPPATLTGTRNITQFANQGGQLVAIGTPTGAVTDASGTALAAVTNLPVTLPATGATGRCRILDLTIAPITLDMLGRQVTALHGHRNGLHLGGSAGRRGLRRGKVSPAGSEYAGSCAPRHWSNDQRTRDR